MVKGALAAFLNFEVGIGTNLEKYLVAGMAVANAFRLWVL
jgi:hypothetical protein